MFDIYEALKSGKSVDEIANSFVNELNKANQQIEAERQAEEAAKAAAAEKANNASGVADHLNAFIRMYYPEKVLAFTGDDIIALCEASKLATDLGEKLKNVDVDTALDEFANALTAFFKENGI